MEEENPTESEQSGRDNTQTCLLQGKHVSDSLLTQPGGREAAGCKVNMLDRSGNKVCFRFRVRSLAKEPRPYKKKSQWSFHRTDSRNRLIKGEKATAKLTFHRLRVRLFSPRHLGFSSAPILRFLTGDTTPQRGLESVCPSASQAVS